MDDPNKISGEELQEVVELQDWELKRHIREEEDNVKVRAAAQHLTDAVNLMGRKPEDIATVFVKALTRQHRTLQQGTIALLVNALVQYGQLEDRFFDGRNDYSKAVCQDILNGLERRGRVYDNTVGFPLI